ncbi:MAG: DUF1684 domain-containing protein [Acidobacteria bacterium]|nr:DUF1684 domain-containing protein [Acidobacteriota bacterium]
MTSNIRHSLAQLFAGFVLLAVVAVAASAQDSYDQTIQKWRAEREAKLKADDGWLTVTGLFWLREGQNEFGSAPTNDIVLPPGSAPDKLGSFEWLNGKITLRVAEGAIVTANSKPVRELVLHSETVKRPEVIEAGDLSFLLLKRGDRWGIRLKDKNSFARQNFTGLRWYPAKESFRIAADFIAYDQPKDIPIVNILGDIENYKSPGLLKFKLNGQEYTLEPVNSGGDRLFIIFRDLTSNKTTYAASRFLYADAPKDGKVILDFNQAINPPCAFTAYATCPLPPKQNRLNVAIEAGELIYLSAKQTTAQAR